MRRPLAAGELARLTGVDARDVERYRAEGLLDPEGTGTFDEFDLTRLRVLALHRESGRSIDEIIQGVRDESLLNPVEAELLFGLGAASLSMEEAAEQAGLSVDHVRALRTALGMSAGKATERDVEALRSVKRFLDLGLPWEAILEAARVYGDSMRRLAFTEHQIVRSYLIDPLVGAGASMSDVTGRVEQLAQSLVPLAEPLMLFVHRQHLLRAMVDDVLGTRERGDVQGTIEATILFVDIALFTPLAEVHGDEVAASVLERFDGLVRALVLEHRGTLVKQIGDAFMLTFREPADAIRFAIALDEAVASEEQLPALHIGVNSGPVLYRLGDYVGNTVNVASRIAGLAEPNEILLTEPVATAAKDEGIAVEPIGPRVVKGVTEPLNVYRVARIGRRATLRQRDPVCGMLIAGDPAARLLLGGFEFVFCSETCLRRFLEDPARYAASARSE